MLPASTAEHRKPTKRSTISLRQGTLTPKELPTSLCQMVNLMVYPVDISRTSIKVTNMVKLYLVPSKDQLIENL